MSLGATRDRISDCESLSGQEESWNELSALQGGDGGATVCADGRLDGWVENENEGCGLGGLVKA